MKQSILSVLVAFMCFSLQGQSMKTTTQKGVDFTAYETFTVMKGEFMTPPDERKVSEEALFQSIKAAVIKELEARGYKFLDDSTAQLHVSYVAGTFNLTDAGTNGPLGQTPASTPSDMNQSRSWTSETREAMLAIDISDSHNKKELWNATGNLALDGVDMSRALDASVYKAFRKFPDKNKKKKK